MAIADRLNKLRTDIEDTYQAITEIGGIIPSDKNTNNIPEAIRSVYDNLPKVSDTGTNVSLSPTLKGRLGIVPKGNTLQDGTPAPDTPVEIQSATGTQKVVVSGKNLFDGEYQNAIVGSDGKYNTNNSTRTAMIKIKPNTTYFIKKYENTGIGTRLGIVESSTQLSSGESGTPIYYNETATEYSYTSGANAYYLYVYVTNNITNIPYLMVSKGNTATPYQPYQEPQEVDIELGNIELNKIGNYEDYIDGTPDNWVLYKNIGKVVLDGSISFDKQDAWSSVGNNTNAFYKGYTAFDNMKPSSVVMSDNFVYLSNIVTNDSYGIYLTTNLIIRVPKTITNKSELNNWLSTHNVEILYPLATPIETPITDTNLISQLNELYYLQSYNDTTNIDVTGNLSMRITASAIKGA